MSVKAYGPGKRLLESIPIDFWESDFLNTWFLSVGHEIDKLDRWVHIPLKEEWQRALAGTQVNDGAIEDSLHPITEGMLPQMFARMTSNPKLWENFLEASTDISLTAKERRERILATVKQRSISPTPAFIKGVVEAIVVQAEVIPDDANYQFEIHVIEPRGAPPAKTIDALTSAVDKAKPAHLAYTIIYGETTWETLGTRTWVDLGTRSWATLDF